MVTIKLTIISAIVIVFTTTVKCQRSPYAGSRPIGYHDRLLQTNQQSSVPQIVSRFGDDNNGQQRPPIRGQRIVQSSPNFAPIIPQSVDNRIDLGNSRAPQRLPYDAYNDRALVEHYNRLPIDNRPFWLINAQHIERHRNQADNQVGNFNPVAPRSSFLGSRG